MSSWKERSISLASSSTRTTSSLRRSMFSWCASSWASSHYIGILKRTSSSTNHMNRSSRKFLISKSYSKRTQTKRMASREATKTLKEPSNHLTSSSSSRLIYHTYAFGLAELFQFALPIITMAFQHSWSWPGFYSASWWSLWSSWDSQLFVTSLSPRSSSSLAT
jgi:hypothetical protein